MSNGKKSAVSDVHPDAKGAADVPAVKRPTDVFECLLMIYEQQMKIAVAMENIVVVLSNPEVIRK